MNALRSLLILLLMTHVSATVFAQQLSPEREVEHVFLSPQTGRWQVIHLPQAWQKKYWPAAKYQSLYIALRGPHPEDLGNYMPCQAPQRLLLGTEDNEARRKEYLLTCLDTCAPQDNEKKVYRDLWARNTRLEGITAQLLRNGNIEVIEHFNEQLGLDRKRIKDVGVVEKNRYGEETRLRTHQFTATDFITAAREAGEASCTGRSLNPSF